MSVYGNILSQNTNSIIENYIDKCFLESVLNESVSNIEADIKALSKKDKITNSDFKAIYDKIEKIENAKTKAKLYCSLILTILSFVEVGALYSLIGSTNVAKSFKISASTIVTSLINIGLINGIPEVDSMYERIIKIEAKLMKNRDKLKALGSDEDKEKLEEIENSIKFCEDLKKKRKEVLRLIREKKSKDEAFKEDVTVYESMIYLQEYKGNDIKNNIFIQVLDDVDGLLKYFMEKIKIYDEACEKMIEEAEKIKTPDQAKKAVNKIGDMGSKINADEAKIKDQYGPVTWGLINSEVKKFNNKYSYVSLNERKKMAVKIKQYKDQLNKYGKKYTSGGPVDNKRNDIYDKIREVDPMIANRIDTIICSWINAIINEVNDTIEDIDYTMSILKVEKIENSLIYKILNPRKKSE